MKEELEKLIEEGISNLKIGELYNVHRTTVAKWLKSFNIIRRREIFTNCILCNKNLKENPRNRKCCATCVTRIRRYRLKKRAVEYKGGKCVRCGYKKSLAALEFHHLESELKDFSIAEMNHKSFNSIKKELDKCILLCSNCHREEHSKYSDINFAKLVR